MGFNPFFCGFPHFFCWKEKGGFLCVLHWDRKCFFFYRVDSKQFFLKNVVLFGNQLSKTSSLFFCEKVFLHQIILFFFGKIPVHVRSEKRNKSGCTKLIKKIKSNVNVFQNTDTFRCSFCDELLCAACCKDKFPQIFCKKCYLEKKVRCLICKFSFVETKDDPCGYHSFYRGYNEGPCLKKRMDCVQIVE